jgi:SAM-dependent methyltransferase
VAVELARNKAIALGLQDRVTFYQMNGEALTFPDDTFDLIHGAGILHHMDLQKAFNEICRTLKPTGTAVFIEPMGHNWFINLYRRLTPKLRTPDEHALTMTVLDDVNRYFDRVDLSFFHLASLLSIPFSKQRIFERLLRVLDGVDEVLFRRLPISQRLAWQVVLRLSRPRKQSKSAPQGMAGWVVQAL